MNLGFDLEAPAAQAMQRRMMQPWMFRGFLLSKLPMAAIAGLSLRALDVHACEVRAPFGFRTQNPFGSMYFAVMAMAAEMSTGAVGVWLTRASASPMSMLVVDLRANFSKKAAKDVTFACENVPEIVQAVRTAAETGQATTVIARSVGRMDDGVEVSRFEITWSFRVKSR